MAEVYIYIYIMQQKKAQIMNLKKSVPRTVFSK